MKVEDVMTCDVVTCSPSDTVESAIRMMSEKNISGIPVMEGGRLLGIVTEGDIMKLLAVPERSTELWLPSPLEVLFEIPLKELVQLRDLQTSVTDVSQKPVSDIMSRDVKTVSPSSDIEDAASIMVRHRVKRLPVVQNDKLVGILTREDIIHGLGGKVKK
jgi:CBS domain-containing protein